MEMHEMLARQRQKQLLAEAEHCRLSAQWQRPDQGARQRMDQRTFDAITRAFGGERSRRAAIQRLGHGSLAVLLAQMGIGNLTRSSATAAARELEAERRKRQKRKGRKPKLQRNGFGCVPVGKACRGNSANCCSGICEGTKPKKGKKDTSRCVAHNVGACQAEQDFCAGVEATCGDEGTCFRTTGNASFCGDGGQCVTCQTDADCEAAGFLAGAACVVCNAECQDISGGTACFRAGV